MHLPLPGPDFSVLAIARVAVRCWGEREELEPCWGSRMGQTGSDHPWRGAAGLALSTESPFK